MSLTPLDESNKEGRRDASADGDGGSKGLFARLLDRTRAVVDRVRSAFGRPYLSDSPTDRETRQLERPDKRYRHSTTALRGSKPEIQRGGIQWSSTDRRGTSTADDQSDGPEIVASWENGGLTLSERGDDDAQISSDTWAEIER